MLVFNQWTLVLLISNFSFILNETGYKSNIQTGRVQYTISALKADTLAHQHNNWS